MIKDLMKGRGNASRGDGGDAAAAAYGYRSGSTNSGPMLHIPAPSSRSIASSITFTDGSSITEFEVGPFDDDGILMQLREKTDTLKLDSKPAVPQRQKSIAGDHLLDSKPCLPRRQQSLAGDSGNYQEDEDALDRDKAPTRPARRMTHASSVGTWTRNSKTQEEIAAVKNRNNSFLTSATEFSSTCWSEEGEPLPFPTSLDPKQMEAIIKELKEKEVIFRNVVDLKDRTYRFRTYKRCFVGSQAVDKMIKNDLAKTRQEAVKLGNQFLLDQQFRHVCGEHQFEDQYLFYRFVEDESDSQGSGEGRWFSSRLGSTATILEEEQED